MHFLFKPMTQIKCMPHFHEKTAELQANCDNCYWLNKNICFTQYKPSITQAIIEVKMGDEDLTVSVNETATYFKLIREHTMAPNLWKERKINKTVSNHFR